MKYSSTKTMLFILLICPQMGFAFPMALPYEALPAKDRVYKRLQACRPAAGAGTGTVIINEILFNPRPLGADFIEIYNRSNQTIDLKGWCVANRNAAGNIASQKLLSASSLLMEPGGYRVITENPIALQEQYPLRAPPAAIELSSLPSYPNTAGVVVLLDAKGEVADEVAYSEKWHFSLLNNLKGVSLERIDPTGASADPNNWRSASTASGYATPGYQNSQLFTQQDAAAAITIDPPVFSPDNDGYNDFAIIRYQFSEPGNVCTIVIFSRAGVAVRYLTRNALCGTSGFFRWDGLNDHNRPLGIGTYIVVVQVFNLNGKTWHTKRTVTLARQLK